MEPFIQKNNSYYSITEWTNQYPELVVGFTTKHGGVSKAPFETLNFGFHVGDDNQAVYQNRLVLSKEINFPLHSWVGAEQTHQTKIRKITKTDSGKGSTSYEDSFKATDGFYTSDSGVLLTLAFADCVPLYFFAQKKRLIGVAHAGWKGTVSGIGPEMITAFQQEGVQASDVHVVIGPSICGNCYVVDNRVISLLQNKLEGVEEKPYNLIKDNQYKLNLREANRQMLMASGVQEHQISVTQLCTSCHNDQFYSHRKENGQTGRMISFMGWKEHSD
jgi:polyphenol oxidase